VTLRALLAIGGALAATVVLPVSAQAAVHPHCTGYTYTDSVTSYQITLTETQNCVGEGQSGALNLWLHVPISDGWTWVPGITFSSTATSETVSYVCQGHADNTWDLQEATAGSSPHVTDYCGPVEP
jgi:hypothetical protein